LTYVLRFKNRKQENRDSAYFHLHRTFAPSGCA